MEIGPKIVFKFDNGFYITDTVFFTWCLVILMIVVALVSTRHMQRIPGKAQTCAEFVVEKMYGMVESAMGPAGMGYAPYFSTIFIFLLLGNSLGLFGFRPITADVNTTFALSIITFFLVWRQGLKGRGLWGHIKQMSEPYAFMLPLNLIEKISLPISLGFRLFGNILGGVIVMDLLFSGLGNASEALHLPIPLLQAVIPLPANFFFDMFEPVLQAYIFTMLSMVFISLQILVKEDVDSEVKE